MKYEIKIATLAIPDGWRPVAWRPPLVGESFLNSNLVSERVGFDFKGSELIIERIKKYREPVLPADAGKMCEFSDTGRDWEEAELVGFISVAVFPWRSPDEAFKQCRIEVDE